MKVFISYCGNGKPLAERLRDRFKENGVDAWTYSKSDYTIGDKAWLEIYAEIANREWMVVLGTECTRDSFNQCNEYRLALRIGVRVVAYSAQGIELSDELKGRNIGTFNGSSYEADCGRLIKDLKERREKRETEEIPPHAHLEKLVELIRGQGVGLDGERVANCRNIIVDNYLQNTMIRDVTRIGFLLDDEGIPEGQFILYQDKLEQFNQESVDYRLVCLDIARAIVNGEAASLHKALRDIGKTISASSASRISSSDYSVIEETVTSLVSRGYTPNIILAPVQQFGDFVDFFKDKITWRRPDKGQRDHLVLPDIGVLSIYWSNIFAPSNEFVIYDKSAVRCRVKPDKEDGAIATGIGISPLYRDKVVFLAFTLFKLEILQPEGVAVIPLPSPSSGGT